MSSFEKYEHKLERLIDIERYLSSIKEVDNLLENILKSACDIVNADAGSIYSYESDDNMLKIRYSVNKTLQRRLIHGEKLAYISKSFPVDTNSICGACAVTKKIINIPDAYNLSEFEDEERTVRRTYSFKKDTDILTDYRTCSMLTVPLVVEGNEARDVLGVIQIINAQDGNGNVVPFDEEDEFFISHFASSVCQTYQYAYLTKKLVERLNHMAQFRDPKETGAHVERVSRFSVEIYDRYAANKNIDEVRRNSFRDLLGLASKCHDVGKVGILDSILKKKGPLTEEERNVMKGHTLIGAQIFSPVSSPLDEMALNVCLHHHEYFDGSSEGYPGRYPDYMNFKQGESIKTDTVRLRGEEIPLEARIVAIADVYDALRHSRSYKDEWSKESTFNQIKSESGTHFDPELVEAFLQIKDRIELINASMT